MTYPPTGGYDPQQYHVSSQPPQPNDPYSQGYNAQPPPPGYDQGQGQYPPQPGYDQGQGQYPPPPNMTPPVGVQPGYPQGGQPGYPQGGSPLPPPIPPATQGGSNLGIILGVIVGLVVILGVAAVLIVPGMLEDEDEGSTEAGEDTTSEAEATEEEPSEEPEETPSAEEPEATEDTGGGSFGDWGTPVSSDEFDPNTPEGAGLSWQIAADQGDDATMEELMCASPSASLQTQYEIAVADDGDNYDFLLWGLAKAEQGGSVEVWAGWTWSDAAPASEDDMISGGDYFSVVEEDGTWKVCDVWY